MPTALTAQRGIDPAASTTPIPRVDVTLQLSARTVAWLADRPRARELVGSVWDKLTELELERAAVKPVPHVWTVDADRAPGYWF
ncbi:MAG TPA: hypothetical protein VIW48_08940 [Nitrospiraceae bacterium]